MEWRQDGGTRGGYGKLFQDKEPDGARQKVLAVGKGPSRVKAGTDMGVEEMTNCDSGMGGHRGKTVVG